jgi:hypothetical protein
VQAEGGKGRLEAFNACRRFPPRVAVDPLGTFGFFSDSGIESVPFFRDIMDGALGVVMVYLGVLGCGVCTCCVVLLDSSQLGNLAAMCAKRFAKFTRMY